MVMIPPAITHGNDGQYQIIKRKDYNFIQSRLATTRLLRIRFDSNYWRRRKKNVLVMNVRTPITTKSSGWR
jgi:hypothetical protein